MWEVSTKKLLVFFFTVILSACIPPQVTEETDCCLAILTETETPVLTLTQTPNPTRSVEAQTAISAFETKIAGYPRTCENDMYSPGISRFSPNGMWLEQFCYSESDKDLILTISSREKESIWKLLYHDYIPKLDFFPDGGMLVTHWSKDGKYVFFNAFLGGDGGECYRSIYEGGSSLSRLNLQTGDITKILPPINNNWYIFSLSHTDRRLVYGARANNLKILDIRTGYEIDISHEKEFSESGGFVWSSDGLKFIYTTVLYSENYWERLNYSVRLVDAQTGVEKILIESPTDCYNVIEWENNNILKIEKSYNESIIEFDLSTNTIISETPINP